MKYNNNNDNDDNNNIIYYFILQFTKWDGILKSEGMIMQRRRNRVNIHVTRKSRNKFFAMNI
jgi:hypothetical protein